jgi:hypothetical protein
MIDEVNSTKIYCKNFCKCHNIPPVQQEYDNKKTVLCQYLKTVKIKIELFN